MFSGDLGKPRTIYPWGPTTEPQFRQLYHGMGTPHSLVYSSNPVSWLMDEDHQTMQPYLNINSANVQTDPIDRRALEEVEAIAPYLQAPPNQEEPPPVVANPWSSRRSPLLDSGIGNAF